MSTTSGRCHQPTRSPRGPGREEHRKGVLGGRVLVKLPGLAFVFILLLSTFSGCDSLTGEQQPYWHAYFPLEVGNTWEYVREGRNGASERWRQTVVGEAMRDGESYFLVEHEFVPLEIEGPNVAVEWVRYGSDDFPEVFGTRSWHCWGNCTRTDETFTIEQVAIESDVVTDSMRTEVSTTLGGSRIGESRFLKGVGLTFLVHETLEETTRLTYARIGGNEYGISQEPAMSEQAQEWTNWIPLEVGNVWEFEKTWITSRDTALTRMEIISDTVDADGFRSYRFEVTTGDRWDALRVSHHWGAYFPPDRQVTNLIDDDWGVPWFVSACGDCRFNSIEFDGDLRIHDDFDGSVTVYRKGVGFESASSAFDNSRHRRYYVKIGDTESGRSREPGFIYGG